MLMLKWRENKSVPNNFNKCTDDSSNTWQNINELTSIKSGKKSLTFLKFNGVCTTSSNMLSNELNDHFTAISPNLSEKT